MDNQLFQVIKHWGYISSTVKEPKNKREYELLVKHWKELVELVGDNEKHELISLLDVVSYFIDRYNQKHVVVENRATGVEVLKLLMQSNQLRQRDLSEIGSQGVVSEILSGKRELNVRQIKLLAKRFKIAPATFL